ncbi:MAG TPA: hypothetical protein DEG43_00700 [Acidimicrobiaceae bacterium]|nr:hypothetical protein [Acidimicrobiaceae bacterium]
MLRNAAIARNVPINESELLALANQLGSVQAAQTFLSKSPQELVSQTRTVKTTEYAAVVPSVNKEAVQQSNGTECSSRIDRYSTQTWGGIELNYHRMQTDWCYSTSTSNLLNVTSVSAIRVGYGTTVAGQLEGYRWTAEPVVQEQLLFTTSFTAKPGQAPQLPITQGKTRMTGHWAICFAGPFDWACPVERDAHTVVIVGTGNNATAQTYNT